MIVDRFLYKNNQIKLFPLLNLHTQYGYGTIFNLYIYIPIYNYTYNLKLKSSPKNDDAETKF